MTDKQREASRLNSLHSTGPRTDAGKQRSSMNALKSGIDAKTIVLPNESQDDYNQLVTEWHGEHQPTTCAARAIVDRLVAGEWIFRRLFQLQSTIILRYLKNTSPRIIDQNFPVEEAFHQKENSLIRIQAQVNHINRNFHKDLDQLNFLKAQAELAAQPAEPEPAAEPAAAPAPAPEVPQPAECTLDNPSPASFLNQDIPPAPKPPARAETSAPPTADPPKNEVAGAENKEELRSRPL